MTPYPKYKDSGIEWIEKIPSTWKLTKLKHVVSKIGSGVTPRGGSEAYQDSGIPLLRSQNIHFDGLRLDDVAFISEEIHDDMSNSKVKSGDVLLNITGASIGRCFYWPDGNQEANVNQHVCIVRPSEKADTRFIYNFLCSGIGQFQIDYCQNGANREGLSNEQLGGFFFPLPPLPEQKAIAAYLDDKTTKIDRLLQAKRRQIVLLKEERTALINQAVTRGLDPEAPLKDSGVEWIGKIPKHWEVKKLKFIGDVLIGVTYSPADIVDAETGTLVLRSSNIQGGELAFDDNVYVKGSINERQRIRVGDILICARNGSAHLVGKNVCITKEMPSTTFGAFMSIFRSPYWNYLAWFFKSGLFSSQSGQFSTSTINQLTTETLNEMRIAMPMVTEEREEIVAFLKGRTQVIDTTISKIEKEIDLLQEYRTALISEVVTGKVRVAES